ncbi:restriction endonuclease subunit S [Paraburkholderia sp.]|uniref:restriction endonuclease subunit S n=1 Tax=Paraburkholderia sp. TaxID=1926495 RepID=UPI003C7A4533
MRTSNIQKEVEWDSAYFVPAIYVKREDQFVRPGDVLMSMANSYELVGKVAIAHTVPHPAAFGAFLAAIRPTTSMDGRYLFHLLRTNRVQSELRQGSTQTTNIANISIARLSDIEVPIAPLPEQKRIADKLDAVLARVDACRERLDGVATHMKRFRQSILLAAVSGRLTEDWRAGVGRQRAADPVVGASQFPDTWIDSRIELVATVGTGSTPLRSESGFYAEEGVAWVTSAATGNEFVRVAAEYVTDAAIKAHRLKLFPVGTLLVAMYGEGKTRGQVAELAIEATINQACAAIVVDESKALRSFIKLALQANYMEMRKLAEGGNQPNLNLSKVKGFPLRLPPLAEQQEIARRIAVFFAFTERLETRLGAARSAVDALTPALLSKAFRGELVPQDPTDEPAAELLKLLTEQRSGAGAAVKGSRGKRASRAMLSEEESPVAEQS